MALTLHMKPLAAYPELSCSDVISQHCLDTPSSAKELGTSQLTQLHNEELESEFSRINQISHTDI